MHSDPLVEAIDAAIIAHAEWKRKLHRSIETGVAHLTPGTASCDDKCALGMWLYGTDITHDRRKQIEYDQVRASHALFHRTAGSVLSYVERGNISAAMFIMEGEYDFRSDDLVQALTNWRAKVLTGVSTAVSAEVARR
jgi:methyl-accepting chemotaxis protein